MPADSQGLVFASLGVEEELLLVDEGNALISAREEVLAAVGPRLPGRISSEIFTEQIELKTGVCHAAGEVLEELRAARKEVAEDFGDLLRTPPCGLHVHVGIPDPDLAVRLANAFRLYLPVLQALSANSPFRDSADSGHASARTSVVRSYPRFQVPRQFRDYEDFCRVADQLIAAAGVDDYTYIWWDAAPTRSWGRSRCGPSTCRSTPSAPARLPP